MGQEEKTAEQGKELAELKATIAQLEEKVAGVEDALLSHSTEACKILPYIGTHDSEIARQKDKLALLHLRTLSQIQIAIKGKENAKK